MKKIIAVVGMPGSGKSEAVMFFKNKGFACVRFGDLTDETLKSLDLEENEENERKVREQLRREKGMAVYAAYALSKIEEILKTHDLVVLDGLYSWEEYKYLIEKFGNIILLAIYASPVIRYERLAKRLVRPLTHKESRQRDTSEIENLNKSGPIAIADYLIKNESTKEIFFKELEQFFSNLENDSL